MGLLDPPAYPLSETAKAVWGRTSAPTSLQQLRARQDLGESLALGYKVQPINLASQFRPTVTAVSTSSSLITSQVLVPPTSAFFTYLRANCAQAGPSFPQSSYWKQNNVTSSSTQSTFSVTTMFFGLEIGIKLLGTGANYRIRINGRIASDVVTLANDGQEYYQKFTFSSAGWRQITLEGGSGLNFGGFIRGPKDTLQKPPAPPGPRCIIMGDSYTEPTGSSFTFTGWATHFAEMLGWDAWASGSGGTGYMNNSGIGGRFKFADRLTDITSYNPRIAVIAGGINDAALAAANPSGFDAEVDAVLGGIRTALPDLDELIVVGPWDPWNGSGVNRDAVRTALIAKATQYGAVFIDMQGVFTGTGTVGSPSGTGNQDYFMGADGTHPTQDGHDFLARQAVMQYLAIKYPYSVVDDQTYALVDAPPVFTINGATPEGVITMSVGRSLVDSFTDGSVWSKTSGSGNTGWRQLAWVNGVTASTPTTGATLTVNALKFDETLNVTPAGTLAALTITLPTAATSRVGQTVDVMISQIITSLTVNVSGGGTVSGATPDTSAVNSSFGYRCTSTAGAGTWKLYRKF